jgi:putative ABC transport system permease protein
VEDEYPGEDPEHGVTMVPLHQQIVGDVRPALLTLLGAVAFVLLIACTNVANLLLTRAVSRHKETGIRVALGADRWRITRQLLVEGTVLALLSGVVGLALAVGGVRVILASLPAYVPRTEEIRVDAAVLGATLAVALGTGLLFGLVPALKASRPDLNHELKEGSAGATVGRMRHRTHYALAVGEVALAGALLVGATLMLDSFRRMRGVDPGFDPENLTTMTVTIPNDRYRTAGEVVDYYLGLPERLEALPGIATVSAVNWLPVSGGESRGSITIEARPFAPGEAPGASFRRILPNYFSAMGVPLLQGREFVERDRGEGEFVVIINEHFARAFWPDDSPIGSRIKVGPAEQEPWLTVVGVVADVHNVGLDISPQFATYEPHAQRPWRTMNLAIRTDGDPQPVTRVVRNELRARDPNILIYNNSTMQMRITESLADRRFLTSLIGLFSAVALALTAVGIYGIMGYTVTQRLREMGIRMALGAGTVHVHRLVLRQSAGLSLGGIGIGFVLALGLTRFMRSLLFGVSTTDPVIFIVSGTVLIAVALLAAYLPARRATRVDPVTVLRSE